MKLGIQLLVFALVSACADQEVVLEQETAAIEGDRALLDQQPKALLEGKRLTIPDSIGQADMSQPVRIAFAGPPTCRLAVADALDRAIHLFDPAGNYETSIFGGGRDTSRLVSIGDMTISSNGSIVVANPLDEIGVFHLDGTYSKFSINKPDPDAISFSSLAVVDDTVFDHWILGVGARGDYSDWSSAMPSILSYSGGGNPGRSFGQIQEYPGQVLNVAMNEGVLAAGVDTVWFGRRVDATLTGHPTGGGIERVVRLPLLHRMQTIRETPVPGVDGIWEAIVEYHLHDLSVDGSGNFFVVQAVSWPREEGGLFRPDLGLAVYGNDGSPLGLFDTSGGELRAVSVADSFIYLLVLNSELRRSEVYRYPNPLEESWGCP